MRFNAKTVKAVRPQKARVDHTDPRYPGLVLRVTPSGTRSWRLRTLRSDGSSVWATLGYASEPARRHGDLEVLGLAEALEIWRASRGSGSDPKARLEAKIRALEDELAAARLEAGYGVSFAELAEEFFEVYSARRHGQKYRANLRRMFERYPLPAWGVEPAASIRRADVAALLKHVAEGAPIQANRLLAGLRKLLGWAVETGKIPSNPCADLTPPAQERTRDMALEQDEIAALWYALERRVYPDPSAPRRRRCQLSPILADALLFLLVTIQRRQEVAAMRWAGLKGQWWDLEAEETKPGRPHRVYLSTAARKILERQTPSRFRGPYVFPGRGVAHVHPDTLSHAFGDVRDGLIAAGALRGPYTPHDLRRTGRTALSKLGVLPHVADRILNHAVPGVRKRYDLYRWDDQVREALEAWGDHLSAVLESAAAARL